MSSKIDARLTELGITLPDNWDLLERETFRSATASMVRGL